MTSCYCAIANDLSIIALPIGHIRPLMPLCRCRLAGDFRQSRTYWVTSTDRTKTLAANVATDVRLMAA